LIHAALPSLAVLSAILAYSSKLKLVRISFPDPSLWLWGAEMLSAGERFAVNLMKVIALFLLVVWIFVCAASAIAPLFASLRPLRAYTADLLGSLTGVIALTIAAALGTPPPIWLSIACLPLIFLSPRVLSVISAIAVIALGYRSIEGALFSPYNRLDVGKWPALGNPLALAANRDAHQVMFDLRNAHVTDPSLKPAERRTFMVLRYMYDMPFRVSDNKRAALVVGAGTGNDVAAALRINYARVVSVDIDPVIIQIGKRHHPERPYSDRRAEPVVNDARAYFEQTDDQFDVICFGLLDSHAMFSAMSTLRLDNYVYTVEAMRSAWRHVAPGGALSVSFNVTAGDWIADRIFAVLTEATGSRPRVFWFPESSSKTFVVSKGQSLLPPYQTLFEVTQKTDLSSTRVSTDDWPYLYVRPHTFPTGYVIMLISVLIIAAIGARIAFGSEIYGRGFDPVLFFMGAAFLLIETRGVTDLSLLFGSTWIVNTAVFAGILIMALLANLAVERYQPKILTPFFLALFLALTISYFVRPSILLQLPLVTRGLVGGLINGIPVGFAGIIFSKLLSRSPDPTSSLGSNLLGAMVGGCLEYASMFTGLRFLSAIAIALYGIAFVICARRGLLTEVAPESSREPLQMHPTT
jgi:spermidine synthase